MCYNDKKKATKDVERGRRNVKGDAFYRSGKKIIISN